MINLLPEEGKKILRTEERWKLSLILEILVLIFLFCLILILFSIEISTSARVQSQKVLIEIEEKEINTSEIQNLRKKIVSINQNLSKLDSFYQNQINLTGILEKISKTLLPKMYLTNLSYQRETFKVSLSGFSPTRESLFEFKKNLEREEEFKEIYFPPQNWVKPTDIDFSVTLKIKK